MNESDKLVELWIQKAEHDLGTAILIFNNIPDYYDTLGFHCQQAVEKFLKAYLTKNSIEFKPRHNLSYLLDLISQFEVIDDNMYNKTDKLEQYAVELRYPDVVIYPSKTEIEELVRDTIEIINIIRNWIRK